MKKTRFCRTTALALLCLLVAPLWAAQLWAAETTLPVRRVVLYKHGVAYFEREGKLDGRGDVLLQFKASQMSDVLKSLTVLGTDGAVRGVSYEASDPVSKQLEQFAFRVPKQATLGQLLDQFKGARLHVRLAAGGDLRGSILGARATRLKQGDTEMIALLLDSGELRNVLLSEAVGLRLEDPQLERELKTYLQLIRSSQRRDTRQLRIHTGRAKKLALGYVVEAPVRKTSYRLILDPRKPGEAVLQGWAIVDNTTSEDWKGVSLALVSGLPISFTQNLYQAHYVRRPHVPLSVETAAGPVRHEGALMANERVVLRSKSAQKALSKEARLYAVREEDAAAPADASVGAAVRGRYRTDRGMVDLARSVAVAATGRAN